MNPETNMPCVEREEAIVLLACGELESEAAAEVEAHLKVCAGCAAAFAQETRLHEAFVKNAGEEPSPAMLADCRLHLDEAVDRASAPGFWTKVWAGLAKGGWNFGYRNWLATHPAMGAAVFVIAGVLIGNLAPRWLEESRGLGGTQADSTPMVVSSENASRVGVRAISLAPSTTLGEGMIEVRGVREVPMNLRGTPDDPLIRQALLDVLPNGHDFNLDERMLALEMLRSRSSGDVQVRDSLCQTARDDANPAVRLKALEALRGFQQDEAVRQTLLRALLHDTNAGVRIEAINSLKTLAETQNAQVDRQMMDVLRERMEKDPNTYIRVQSAAAVRQLAQRGVY